MQVASVAVNLYILVERSVVTFFKFFTGGFMGPLSQKNSDFGVI